MGPDRVELAKGRGVVSRMKGVLKRESTSDGTKAVDKPPCFYKAVGEGDKGRYEHFWLTLRSGLLFEIESLSREPTFGHHG